MTQKQTRSLKASEALNLLQELKSAKIVEPTEIPAECCNNEHDC